MKLLTPAVNSKDHIYGNLNAPLELVEYGDYECPYCGRAYPIVKSIQQKLGADLKFVYRNFPLSRVHEHAKAAAVAAEAAGLQHKFWEMHGMLFKHQQRLDAESILLLARIINLDIDRFKEDMQQQNLIDKVESDFDSGLRSGVDKTPTFYINGKKYNGSWEENKLLQHLESQLAGAPVLL